MGARRRSRFGRWLTALVALVALVGCSIEAWRARTPEGTPGTSGGEVRGSVAADVPALAGKGVPSTIRLPGAIVFLKEVTTGAPGARASTDAHGRFRLSRHAPGRYEVCAEAPGFASACAAPPILVEHAPIVLTRDVVLAPTRGALRGRVLLADGTPCYHERPFFAPTTAATVRLIDGAGTALSGMVAANDRGEYVVPGVPGPGAFRLVARCAGAETIASLTLGPNDLAAINPIDVVVKNSPPQVIALTISNAAGVPIQHAAPGEMVTVTVRAQDPDGDRLRYAWGDGSPGFRSLDVPTISWTLAAVPAVNALFVQITDGRGGFANGEVAIATGPSSARFSGRVSEASGVPLAGVTVDVDGTTTTTAPDGTFAIAVGERPRHVLTVRRPGYALLSRVFTTGASDLDLRLERMQRRVCDPAGPCALQSESRAGPATVTLDPGSVVNGEGQVVSTPFSVAIHAYDLARANPIPGELGGFDLRGRPVAMISYGAVDIDLRDRAGKPLKLAPGAKAHVSIPIYQDLLASAPPTIPFLRYDEPSGYWKQETTGTRVGDHYEAVVTHLSAWNADVLFPNSACIKVEVKDDGAKKRAPRFPFTLHMDAQGVKQDFPVTEVLNVLYRLAPNTNVTLEIHRAGDPTALKKFTVPSGGAIDPMFSGVPPKPYNECNGSTVLTLDVPTPLYPFLEERGAIDPMTSTDYYKAIGALDNAGMQTMARGKFSQWKTTNGFPQGEARAIYYNDYDLQLGLDARCTTKGPDVACYMTTYPGDPKYFKGVPEAAIADAIAGTNNSVTLAMEYSPVPNGNIPIVKFYAFDAVGDLADKVTLDSQGPKNVPHACLACHNFNRQFAKDPADKGAMFLPFDPFGFVYDKQTGKTLANQLAAFKMLNAMVKKTNPNTPITTLIDGIALQGPNDSPFVPPGWQGKPFNAHAPWSVLYQSVVTPYCRSCHIAQHPSELLNEGQLSFTLADHWASDAVYIKSNICGGLMNPQYFMPHGEVPFLRFWQTRAMDILTSVIVGLGYTDAFNLVKNPCP